MEITDPLTRKIHLKMSGCPNGCGQHHIGTIGFYGASIKVGGHTMPAYIPHIGGDAEDGEVDLRRAGSRSASPPSASPTPSSAGCGCTRPSATTARSSTTSPTRVGTGRFEDEVRDLALPAEFNLDNMLEFIDWSRRDPYKVERGEGECAI